MKTGDSLARRLNARQFATYSAHPPSRPPWTFARVVLVAASVLLVVLLCVVLVSGVRLVLRDFPSLWVVPGSLLIAFAWTLRPRLDSAEPSWAEVTRDDVPTLFSLLDRVAASSGAPVPHHVALNFDFNAAAGVFGLRRRRRLCLGLPLWGILSPQQRVALLAHEFAHFVNADPARSLLTQPVLATPGALADLVRPSAPATGISSTNIALEILGSLLRPVQRVCVWVLLRVEAGVLAVASRDHQRAEYCADAFAVRLAGTAGTVALMDDLVASFSLSAAVVAAERAAQSSGRAGGASGPRSAGLGWTSRRCGSGPSSPRPRAA